METDLCQATCRGYLQERSRLAFVWGSVQETQIFNSEKGEAISKNEVVIERAQSGGLLGLGIMWVIKVTWGYYQVWIIREHLSLIRGSIHTWGHLIPRCRMKPGLKGKHSRVIHTCAHVTLRTHVIPNQRIAPPRLKAFNYVLILGDCLHPLGFPTQTLRTEAFQMRGKSSSNKSSWFLSNAPR